MWSEVHFLRPYASFLLLPWGLLFWRSWRQEPTLKSWQRVCDPVLLQHLLKTQDAFKRQAVLCAFFGLLFFLIVALSGPAFFRDPVPVYESAKARVVLLSLTEDMLKHDLPPSRLSRVKFKLHDLFIRQDAYPIGLVVFSGEPFIVSPLTSDGKTIDALLPALHPNIMPVDGYRLESALEMGATLIHQSGFDTGDILVMSAQAPTPEAIVLARRLHTQGFVVSMMPILSTREAPDPLYRTFSDAGGGQLLPMENSVKDLNRWLHSSKQSPLFRKQQDVGVMFWRDEGHWFLIPALILCLLFFRRGLLQRLSE